MKPVLWVVGGLCAGMLLALLMSYGHSFDFARVTVSNCSSSPIMLRAQIDSSPDFDVSRSIGSGEEVSLTVSKSKIDTVLIVEREQSSEGSAQEAWTVSLSLHEHGRDPIDVVVGPDSIDVSGTQEYVVEGD